MYGSVSLTPSDITSVSQQKVEIIAAKVFVVSCASSVLPIQIADASRPLAEDLDAPQVLLLHFGMFTSERKIVLRIYLIVNSALKLIISEIRILSV